MSSVPSRLSPSVRLRALPATLLTAVALLTACAGHPEGNSAPARASTAGTPIDARPTAVAIINGEEVPAPAIAMGDPAVIARILDEGKNRNQVMNHLTHICTHIGPRLTGSSNAEAANRWAMQQFQTWGLANAHLDEWGTIPVRFDRGPSTGKISLAVERDVEGEEGKKTTEWRHLRDLEFTTHAWAAGTTGPVRGRVIKMPETDAEFEAEKDNLKGAWVLIPPAPMARGSGMRSAGGIGARYSHRKELAEQAKAEGFDASTLPIDDKVALAEPAGFLSTSRDERVWTSSVPGWRELDPANIPDDVEVSIRLSDYDYLNSRWSDGDEVYAEFDLPHTFTPGPIPVYNTVAEITGTQWPDQVVIVSAHLDSWNGVGSLGTTDNGTGSSVTIEAARLLMAAGAKPKRTIRFILWTGEEQGLLGSRSYVERHAADLANISAVFVDDGGTNYEGGLQCTDEMAPMLAAATAPVNNQFFDDTDQKYLNVNIQPRGKRMPRTGGSDHASFVAKGIPGFFWDEEGRAEYGYGWHTQNDKLTLAIPTYLQQSATCAAITAYNLACAEQMLPREVRDEAAEAAANEEREARRRRREEAQR
ncbi:MAG: M20/M25/M40 family metallo-hydrolase, partial [Phycisphaerales bacterium]|nr:M20/M25/M40 family metallo-hydrolase [Phycisphaerales bacterium]